MMGAQATTTKNNSSTTNDEQHTTTIIRINTRVLYIFIICSLTIVSILLGSNVLNNNNIACCGTTTTTASQQAAATSSTILPRSSAVRCPSNVITPPPQNLFRGQRGEDRKLLRYFSGLCNGTYIELGALDGVQFSNTHVFNKGLQWRGVLIELGPINYQGLVKNRKNELGVVHAGICKERKTVQFVESKAVGGIVELASETFQKQWWQDPNRKVPVSAPKPIQCLPMNEVLQDNVGDSFYFDFFSLDVEGAEYEVVQTLDFARYQFGVILVEADEHNERKNIALRTHLEENGYTQLEPRSDSTEWFVHRRFHAIYANLLSN